MPREEGQKRNRVLLRPHSEAGEAVLRVGRVGDGAEGDAFEIRLGVGEEGREERGVSGDIWAICGNRQRWPLTPRQAHLLTLFLCSSGTF